jgi:hypothetical protein
MEKTVFDFLENFDLLQFRFYDAYFLFWFQWYACNRWRSGAEILIYSDIFDRCDISRENQRKAIQSKYITLFIDHALMEEQQNGKVNGEKERKKERKKERVCLCIFFFIPLFP